MSISQKPHLTIGDVVTRLRNDILTPTSVRKYIRIIEREWFICEERRGAYNPITLELRNLRQFLERKIIPLMEMDEQSMKEGTPEQLLETYILRSLSAQTLARVLIQASPRDIRGMLE
ncbi:MAG: hypothetical protein GF411_02500 [Candidatus Lokiarchaeota archaeon]|nr:hypothetical protein [Candidatus Lokiarchaeota archaeon]